MAKDLNEGFTAKDRLAIKEIQAQNSTLRKQISVWGINTQNIDGIGNENFYLLNQFRWPVNESIQ